MDNLYTIDMVVDDAPIASSLDTTIGKYIAEKFGVAFNYTAYSGDITEQQAILLASGDYAPVQYMQYEQVCKQYATSGHLLNLDDYKEYLPDFYERFADCIKYWRAASEDGGLYKWEMDEPKIDGASIDVYDICVRSDVLEYYGWPQLLSTDDWAEFLKKAVKDFPESFDGMPTVGMAMCMGEDF